MDKSQWIRIDEKTEYSADFDFFVKYQIACWKIFDGTAITSRIENRTFHRTGDRSLTDEDKMRIARLIHCEICNLHYGGQIID